MNLIGGVALFLLAAVAFLVRVAVMEITGGRRERRVMRREFLQMQPLERVSEALYFVDPCKLGVLEADEVYPRAAATLAGILDSEAQRTGLEQAVTQALLDAGCEKRPSRTSLRRVVDLIHEQR